MPEHDAHLLLVTHEHLDHNAVDVVTGDPVVIRSTAGTHRESRRRRDRRSTPSTTTQAGTQRGPNTIFVFTLDGIRIAHFGDLGQAACGPNSSLRSARPT